MLVLRPYIDFVQLLGSALVLAWILSLECLLTVAMLARLSSNLLLSLGETACTVGLLLSPRGLQYAAAISMS